MSGIEFKGNCSTGGNRKMGWYMGANEKICYEGESHQVNSGIILHGKLDVHNWTHGLYPQ